MLKLGFPPDCDRAGRRRRGRVRDPGARGRRLVKFPEGFDKGVLYTTVDRADNKQYRELYTSQAAVDAAKKGEPMPDGTVITLVQYRAKLGADGNPEKDANGRFIKTDLLGYTVMEKRKGWGAEYPDKIRNGEWEYQAFTAGQGGERERQAHRLLRVPQAAAAGERLRVPRTARWRGSNCDCHPGRASARARDPDLCARTADKWSRGRGALRGCSPGMSLYITPRTSRTRNSCPGAESNSARV